MENTRVYELQAEVYKALSNLTRLLTCTGTIYPTLRPPKCRKSREGMPKAMEDSNKKL